MKNFAAITLFVATLLIGLLFSVPFDVALKVDDYIHQNCVTWGYNVPEPSRFTLKEAKPLLRRKVLSKSENFRKGETGKVMYLQIVGKDKFMVAIYWGNGAGDENSSLTFHNKEWFSRDFELVD